MVTAPCSVDVFEQLDDAIRVEAYRSAVSEADILRTEVGFWTWQEDFESSSSQQLGNEQLCDADARKQSPVIEQVACASGAAKKDRTTRMFVDYRRLNAITEDIVYPFRSIEDALQALNGSKYFCVMDLVSGFYQIAVHSDDIQKTAFVTPRSLYEFLRVPFGLKGAPFTETKAQYAVDSSSALVPNEKLRPFMKCMNDDTKRHFDKHHKDAVFERGHLVLLKAPTSGVKTTPYTRLHKILNKLSPVNYEIELVDNMGSAIVHAENSDHIRAPSLTWSKPMLRTKVYIGAMQCK
nr:uncharacterized protein LOC119168177 [Rhipicephalus microplus]